MSRQKRASRREFLESSALAAGAATAGRLSIARSAHAAGADDLKVAMIGCGFRGTGAVVDLLKMKDRIRLVAVADAFEDRARGSLERARRAGVGRGIDVPEDRIFVGLDAYQKAIGCGVDLVLLTTPPGFRPAHYAAAVKAGKHVFMEKPCCVDAPGFRSLMETNDLADQKNLKVVVGLQRRHQGSYIQRIKEIHDGKLGGIRFMRAYLNSGSRNGLGTRPQDDPEEMAFQIRRWTYFVWLGGDMPVEAHVHFLDICNWVMAKDGDPKKAHPIEANGMGGCTWPSNYGELFDQHFVEYTYADGTKLFSQCRRRSGCWISRGVYAHGTKGWSMCRTDGRRQSERPHYQEQIDLVQAIRNNERRNEGWYGATSSMTGVLGRMATYSGQLVRWDDAVAKGPDEGPKRLAFDALPPHLPGPDGRYPIAAPGVYKPY